MGTTIKVIAPDGGGDYTTYAACLAGQAADAATNHQIWRVKGGVASPGGCDFDDANWTYANGTNTINILPFAGHANTTGVYDSTKARMDYLHVSRVRNLTVEQGIQIAAPNGDMAVHPAVFLQTGDYTVFVLDRCLITKIGTGYFDNGVDGAVGELTGTFRITRNVFYMPAANGAAITLGHDGGGYDIYYEISGNSIYGTALANGIKVEGSGSKGEFELIAYNNVVAGPTVCYSTSGLDVFTGGYNCASDATNLGGSNNLASKSAATVFLNPSIGQLLTPTSGSPTIGAGSAAPGFTVDFSTNTYATPPTIGAFETAVPLIATNVDATDGTHTDKVVVTWTGSLTATGYKVYRHTSDNSGAATLIATLGDVLTYDDSSAVAGTTYYYWIKATNSFGDSAFSTSNSGYRLVSAPGNVAATDGTHADKVVVTWDAATSATGYKVYRHTSNNSGAATLIATLGNVLTYDDGSAVAGTTYYYWVKTISSQGDSDFSVSDSGSLETVSETEILNSNAFANKLEVIHDTENLYNNTGVYPTMTTAIATVWNMEKIKMWL